jgi:hypothetical protein
LRRIESACAWIAERSINGRNGVICDERGSRAA